jgi:methionine-rich copper-binding protein CopC
VSAPTQAVNYPVHHVSNEQKIGLLISRVLLFIIGGVLLIFGVVSLLVPRAKFVSSTPTAGSTIAEPPTTVIVNFSNKLSSESQIDVVSTIRLLPSGEVENLNGRSVVISSGLNAGDPSGKSMRAELRAGLHEGLYFVNWRTKSAPWRAITYGKTHFGVGMPVPEHIIRDSGTIWERSYDFRRRRAALVGGVMLIALAFALPMMGKRYANSDE